MITVTTARRMIIPAIDAMIGNFRSTGSINNVPVKIPDPDFEPVPSSTLRAVGIQGRLSTRGKCGALGVMTAVGVVRRIGEGRCGGPEPMGSVSTGELAA